MTPGLNQPKGYPAIGGINPQNKQRPLDSMQQYQRNHPGRRPIDAGSNPAAPFIQDRPNPLFPNGQFPKIGQPTNQTQPVLPDVKIQPVIPQQPSWAAQPQITKPSSPITGGRFTPPAPPKHPPGSLTKSPGVEQTMRESFGRTDNNPQWDYDRYRQQHPEENLPERYEDYRTGTSAPIDTRPMDADRGWFGNPNSTANPNPTPPTGVKTDLQLPQAVNQPSTIAQHMPQDQDLGVPSSQPTQAPSQPSQAVSPPQQPFFQGGKYNFSDFDVKSWSNNQDDGKLMSYLASKIPGTGNFRNIDDAKAQYNTNPAAKQFYDAYNQLKFTYLPSVDQRHMIGASASQNQGIHEDVFPTNPSTIPPGAYATETPEQAAARGPNATTSTGLGVSSAGVSGGTSANGIQGPASVQPATGDFANSQGVWNTLTGQNLSPSQRQEIFNQWADALGLTPEQRERDWNQVVGGVVGGQIGGTVATPTPGLGSAAGPPKPGFSPETQTYTPPTGTGTQTTSPPSPASKFPGFDGSAMQHSSNASEYIKQYAESQGITQNGVVVPGREQDLRDLYNYAQGWSVDKDGNRVVLPNSTTTPEPAGGAGTRPGTETPVETQSGTINPTTPTAPPPSYATPPPSPPESPGTSEPTTPVTPPGSTQITNTTVGSLPTERNPADYGLDIKSTSPFDDVGSLVDKYNKYFSVATPYKDTGPNSLYQQFMDNQLSGITSEYSRLKDQAAAGKYKGSGLTNAQINQLGMREAGDRSNARVALAKDFLDKGYAADVNDAKMKSDMVTTFASAIMNRDDASWNRLQQMSVQDLDRYKVFETLKQSGAMNDAQIGQIKQNISQSQALVQDTQAKLKLAQDEFNRNQSNDAWQKQAYYDNLNQQAQIAWVAAITGLGEKLMNAVKELIPKGIPGFGSGGGAGAGTMMDIPASAVALA